MLSDEFGENVIVIISGMVVIVILDIIIVVRIIISVYIRYWNLLLLIFLLEFLCYYY